MNDYYSAEFDDILVDEAQEFSQSELERLSGSCRSTANPYITPKMAHTFMPGMTDEGIPPIGLPYLKRIYIDHKLTAEESQLRWAFVQAFCWDNIEWARKELTAAGIGRGEHQPGNDACPCQDCEFYALGEDERREFFLEHTEYGRVLAAITNKALRDAWLYGSWESWEGQYFPQFSKERHVVTAAQMATLIQPWWKFFISGDWGFDHPHAVYLHAVDETRRIYTFDEQWGRQVFETDLGKKITALCAQYPKYRFDRNNGYFVFSFDGGKLSPRALKNLPKSIMQLVEDGLGSKIPKPFPNDSSPGTRVNRARLTSQLLESDMWLISDRCEHLIDCLPTLIRDPDNTEDVLKVDFPENGIGDDAYDGASMGLQQEIGKADAPAHVVVERRIAEFAASRGRDVEELDINAKAMLHRRAMADEQKRRNKRRGGLGRIWRPHS